MSCVAIGVNLKFLTNPIKSYFGVGANPLTILKSTLDHPIYVSNYVCQHWVVQKLRRGRGIVRGHPDHPACLVMF